jgi:exonuclease III
VISNTQLCSVLVKVNTQGTCISKIFCIFYGKKVIKIKNENIKPSTCFEKADLFVNKKVKRINVKVNSIIVKNHTYSNSKSSEYVVSELFCNLSRPTCSFGPSSCRCRCPTSTERIKENTILEKAENIQFNVSNRLLTLSNDVETNPGPKHLLSDNIISPNNFFICTYNAKGLGNFKKRKRVINQLHKLPFKSNCIINLQETHITDIASLTYHWKKGAVHSPGTRSSAGVAILYDAAFFDDISCSEMDEDGRLCSLTATKDGEIYSFFNVYAPNDHYQSFSFFTDVKKRIQSVLSAHPSSNIIISGDFNIEMNPNVDSIGRNQSKQESNVVKLIEEILILANLKDSFRTLNSYGGFTWGKNNPSFLRSRLDHILISDSLSCNLVSSSTSPFFNERDHSLVISELAFSSIDYGPGVVRVNSGMLENPEIKSRVIDQLKEVCEQIPASWSPHQVIDFFKYSLRKIMLTEDKAKARSDKNILTQTNEEINLLSTKLNEVLLKAENEKCTSLKKKLFEHATKLRSAIEMLTNPSSS